MADRFEKAMQAIALRSASNGGPTIQDVLEALVAKAEDDDEQHVESMQALEESKRVMEKHCKEAEVRDRRISELAAWQEEWERDCPRRLQRAVEEADTAHGKRHDEYVASLTAEPRRAGDPKTADHRDERRSGEQDRQVWLMWLVGSKVGYILIAVIITAINVLLNYVWFGHPVR